MQEHTFRTMLAAFLSFALIAGTAVAIARGDDDKKADARKSDVKKPSEKKSASRKVDMSDVPRSKKEEKQIRRALGENFKMKHTMHYTVYYDTNEEDVEAFAIAIEATYRSCAKYMLSLGMEPRPLKVKMQSHFFNEFKDYADYFEKVAGGRPNPNMLGVYVPSTNYTYFYNYRNTPDFKNFRINAEHSIEQLAGDLRNPRVPSGQKKAIRARIKQLKAIMNWTRTFGGGVTEGTLQHEVAHQVLHNLGFHAPQRNAKVRVNPRWFAEGIASLFEPISDGKAANWGQMNKERLDQFRQLHEAKQLAPLKEFIETEKWFQRGDAGGLAYPQAWALCYYLSRTNRNGFKKYAETIRDRSHDFDASAEVELKTFEDAFGKVDKNFENRWLNWMKKVN